EVWAKGGEGGEEVARELLRLIDENDGSKFKFAYEADQPIKEKIEAIATRIYGAKEVVFAGPAEKEIKKLEKLGFGNLPICMAKTQYSLTDDPTLIGRPEDFVVTVRSIKVSAGAGFLVALTGDIMTMPGLPKVPSAEHIDVDDNGVISGLF
ncbi:MAG: formate--tetrahydrofolate ligase, partial [Bacillota bacterium]|nr:formate--tetrahydrofolate ligase [Bacillota bacterium]